MKLETKQHKL